MPTVAAPAVEYKVIELGRKAAETAGTVGQFSGYVASFAVDQVNDQFHKGAFRASLATRSHRPLLWDHRPSEVVGVEVSIAEDDRGVLGTWKFADTQLGRDVRTLVMSGSVTAMSVGFIPLAAKDRPDGGRDFYEADLVESSLVSLPCNLAAVVLSSKSFPGGTDLMNAAQRLAQRGVRPVDESWDEIGARLERQGIIALPTRGASIGQQVAASSEVRELRAGRERRVTIRLPDIEAKTLVAAPGVGAVESAADMTHAVPLARSFLDFLPTVETSAAVIELPTSAFASGAAAVGAATATTGTSGTKPEIITTYGKSSVSPVCVAGWVSLTSRVVNDSEALARAIDVDTRQAVRDELEEEALVGSGTAPHMLGIMNWPGILSVTAGANALSSIIEAIVAVVVQSRRAPSVVVLNPTTWGALALATATGGTGTLGPPGALGPTLTVLGVPIVPSAALGAGQGLVGAAGTAALYVQQGFVAELGHVGDTFIRNITIARGEVYACVGVSRAPAWCKISGLA